jgi:hypothetical protein
MKEALVPERNGSLLRARGFFITLLEAWPKSSNAPEKWGGASPWKLVSRVASREYVGVRAILVMLSQCIFPRGTFRPDF